jgi:hypothetical protein
MRADSFIAEMNGLQAEFDSLPVEVTRLVGNLLELTELQQTTIDTLLAVNEKLLGVIDALKE